MKIREIIVTSYGYSGFTSNEIEGVCHQKTLPWISVVQSIEGSYDIGIDGGEELSTVEGGIFLAPSSVLQSITHHADPKTGAGRYRWVFLEIKINKEYRFDDYFSYPLIVPKERIAAFNLCLDNIFSSTDVFSKNISLYTMAKLINDLSEVKPISKLTPAINYISTHYNGSINVSELARMCFMSKSTFFELFKKEKTITPVKYINDYRLSIAAEYIRLSDMPIVKIAKSAGFDDYAYFNKSFRRHFNMSPTEFRKLEMAPKGCSDGH